MLRMYDYLDTIFYEEISELIKGYIYCKKCDNFLKKILVFFNKTNYYFTRLNDRKISMVYNNISCKIDIIYEFNNIYGKQYISYNYSLKRFIKILSHNYDPKFINNEIKINHEDNKEEFKLNNFSELLIKIYNELFKKI